MPQKLWSLFPNGKKTRTLSFVKKQLLPVLLMLAAIFPIANVEAGPLPTQQLTVSFDLDAGRIFGTSEIIIPANIETSLELGDLTPTFLQLDGKNIVADQDNGHKIAIPAMNKAQNIIVSFEKSVPTNPLEATDNLIGKQGITLTGFWHPRLATPSHFQLEADVPASFTAISEANLITSTPNKNGRRFSFKMEQPTTSINLIAGDYVVTETPFADNKKLVTCFFKEDQQLAAHYRDKSLTYLNRYQKLIGEFPYQRFTVVENRLPTGYAMPTFTLLGQA
ncbi:MAG: hypothetical protein OEL55_04745, partial [Desulfobulbaceae bacterium]|nr:hypothetical protein [Desulfobulbaceae bacterium]